MYDVEAKPFCDTRKLVRNAMTILVLLTGLGLGWLLIASPLLAQDGEASHDRSSRPGNPSGLLGQAAGQERLELLAELTSAHVESDPAQAAALGAEALQLLRRAPDTEIEIRILNDLARAHQILQRYEEAQLWATQAERLARATDSPSALATALIHLGEIRRLLNDNDGALNYHLEALKPLEDVADLPRQAYALNAIGFIYANSGYYSRGLDYLMRSYQIYESLGDHAGRAMTLLNMGTVQMKLDDSKAIKHFNESMHIFASKGMSIASPLRKIGEVLMSRGEYEEALEHFQETLEIREREYRESSAGRRLTYALRLALSLRSVCLAHVKTGRPAAALPYCERSLALQEEYGDKKAQAATLDQIGEIHRLKGEHDAALDALGKAIELAAGTDAKEEIQNAHFTLSKIHADLGQYEAAYRELQLYEEVKNELFNEEDRKMTAEMEARFETDRKERANVILRQEQAITALELERLESSRGALIASLGLLILVFFAAHSLYRLRSERRHKTELERLVEQRTQELKRQKETVEAAREKLRDLDRTKSRLFADISHEFRTPLTLTLGPLDDLRHGKHGSIEEAVLEQIDLARTNAGRVLDLINQLLDLARLEAGRLELRARRGDLVGFLRRLYERFSPLAERREITFRFEAPPPELEVYFDPDLLDKAFTNLLANAFKFTPEGGAVSLSLMTITAPPQRGGTERTPLWATVRVRDNGPGISAGEIDKIFDRYYQAESSAACRSTGSGLGLALAKDLIELHGGVLEAESEMGFGTCFAAELRLGREHLTAEQVVDEGADGEEGSLERRVTEPLASLPATPPATPADEETAPDPAADKRPAILVIDDHPELRTYMRGQLENDYRIAEAADGVRGLELARELRPDLVVSDVKMPEMDGFALLKALKADSDLAHLPVILLTAQAEPQSKLQGLDCGADDYLVKPFDTGELRARVDNLIASRRRIEARFERGPAMRPSETEVISAEAAFLERVREAIEEGMGNPDFNVDALASRIGMDRSHLYRRLRALIGQTPSELIRAIRLERAEQLVSGKAGPISEIAYQVGFKSVAHFSKSFRDRYGESPSTYQNSSPSVG